MTDSDGTQVSTVLLVDDHPVLVSGLRTLLDSDPTLCVIGTASSIREAIDAVTVRWPDLVLLDLKLPDGSGVEAIAPILAARPRTRILVFSSFGDEDAVASALAAGAAGFVLKTSSAGSLVGALRSIAAGEAYLDPRLTSTIIGLLHHAQPECSSTVPSPIASLTAQERRVLELIGSGLTNPEIAAALFVSIATVKTHVNRIFQKLGVRTRAQAILIAVQALDLLPPKPAGERPPTG